MMSKFAMISPSAQTGNRATVEFHSHDTRIKISRGLIDRRFGPSKISQKSVEVILRRRREACFGVAYPLDCLEKASPQPQHNYDSKPSPSSH
jgi:hypothetical protein